MELLGGAPVLIGASGERLFLLIRKQFRQQERMSCANLIAVEEVDRGQDKVDELQSERTVLS